MADPQKKQGGRNLGEYNHETDCRESNETGKGPKQEEVVGWGDETAWGVASASKCEMDRRER